MCIFSTICGKSAAALENHVFKEMSHPLFLVCLPAASGPAPEIQAGERGIGHQSLDASDTIGK